MSQTASPIPSAATPELSQRLLEVDNLGVSIHSDEGVFRPLNGVSFTIDRGQAIGIVGESGCGKTMTANALLRILPRSAEITSGKATLRRHHAPEAGLDLLQLPADGREMRAIRGRDIALIFQEPMSAFSPVHTISNQIGEAIRLHENLGRRATRDRVVELLDLVGIPQPERRADDYPFQFSGGMLQRAMIALALSANPSLLIADEPTTALDVTVQAQVLQLIKRLQREMNISLMLITHDLGVVAHMVDYVYVMYLGQVVEEGPVDAIFDQPHHPYTKALLKSIPSLTEQQQVLTPIRGTVPDSRHPPKGCPFHDRCEEVVGEVCSQQMPAHYDVGSKHRARCFKYTPVQVSAAAGRANGDADE
ncbi:ABC transporter ATP-binding protein [Phycisphaerales bacterium AB-hyl4]|uniref:ABC transporter ATP-binding protein n=1 Tax=Natronomicrosphaera hydrolytica TaxID=3242702 RepID=A0ABV4U6A7_9BACT